MVKVELAEGRGQAVFARLPSPAAHYQPNQAVMGIVPVTTGQLLEKARNR